MPLMTAGLITGGIQALSGLFGASAAKKRQAAAARQKRAAQRKLQTLEENRQAIINPYESMEDLSSTIQNPFENLGVATQAAEMQAEEADIALANTLDTIAATGASAGGATALAQAALQSKKGISANIEQQEASNERARAQGQQQQQQLIMAEKQRIQGAEAKGAEFMYREQENRDLTQMDRLSAQIAGSEAREMQAGADRSNAIAGAVGGIASTVGGMYKAGAFNPTPTKKFNMFKEFQPITKQAMSYRNPQQNVDTQSAQGIANLQRTIAGTFGGIVQQELQTQKELGIEQKKLADKRAKELKEYEKLEEQVALGIKNYEIDNPDLKLGDSMAPLVDSYSDIMTRINSGAVTDPKEIAALRSQAADILTMPKRIGNMLESISATDLLMTETESKSGKMGGLDPSQDSNMPEAMRVLMNKAKGDRSTRIEFENGKYKAYIDVTPEGGEKITLTEEQLADYLSGKTQGVQIIPDATEAMENLKNTHIYNTDSKTGKLTPKDSAFGKETTREIKDKKGNVIRIETYKPLKRDYLASAGKAVIESEISAMSKTEKVAFMNNIVAPDTKGFTIDNIEDEKVRSFTKGLH